MIPIYQAVYVPFVCLWALGTIVFVGGEILTMYILTEYTDYFNDTGARSFEEYTKIVNLDL